QFQYSTNSTLSSGVTTVAATPATLAAGSGTSSVTASIASLAANTNYYYRVSASNSLGTTQGNILSFTTATSLPVTFISFTARSEGDDINLGWTVGVNQQAKTYEVEHSVDGVRFSKIGEVANNREKSNYSFVHTHADPGKHYYRILETDFDGESIYSAIVAVTVTGQDLSVSVLNNPAAPATNTRLQINTGSGGTAFVELWSIGGARLSLLQRSVTAGANTIDLPMAGLSAGVYVVKVRVNGHIRTVQVIRK
ncbi:MAG: T9SS type A sorting domain-containing protein, partial [Bacteroidetes bacterium]|nr:T9SS type A sorting domain-containing protein [Bacteroidota bacterium]